MQSGGLLSRRLIGHQQLSFSLVNGECVYLALEVKKIEKKKAKCMLLIICPDQAAIVSY